jgi:hypothetical protein
MLIQHATRENQDIGIVDFIKERKDVIGENQQRALQVHNVVMIPMVNGSAIGKRALVRSIFITHRLGNIYLPINIFSPMCSPVFHVVLV